MYNPWDPATMDEHVHEIYRLSHVYIAPKVGHLQVTVLPCSSRWWAWPSRRSVVCSLSPIFGRLRQRMREMSRFIFLKFQKFEFLRCAELIAQCKDFLGKQCKSDVDGLLSEANDGFKWVLIVRLVRRRMRNLEVKGSKPYFRYANGKCPTMVSALAMSTLRRYQVWFSLNFWNTLPSFATWVVLWIQWEGGKKKKRTLWWSHILTLGTKRGGIQSQILICRKKFWKISNGAWGGGRRGRCHYPHSEIAGFPHGIGCFSIVPPYDSSSQPLIRSKTPVRSFWNTI